VVIERDTTNFNAAKDGHKPVCKMQSGMQGKFNKSIKEKMK
jgi:hypothetical protein